MRREASRLTRHLLKCVQKQFTAILVRLAQQTSELVQVLRIFARTPPSDILRGFSREQIWQLGRLVAVVKQLIHRHLKSARQLLQCLDRRNGVPVLHARDVAPEEPCALFDVALAQFSLLTKFAESIAYDHAGIIPLRRQEGKYLSRRATRPAQTRIVL